MRRCCLLGAIVLLAVFSLASGETQQSDLAGFDDFVTSVMAEWKVPGVAVAAFKNGKVVLAKGYGYRNIEEKLPVTDKTLFAIGSNSKSFTATLLGMLVDDGKIDWDKPVREYLPDFRLYDPFASEQMTPRDLVCHRSGLPRHDALWYASSLTREQLFQRLRYLEPTKSFRTTYQYQNLMFMTAGYLAGQVEDSKWEDLVRARIFSPLDMKRSNFSVEESQRDSDFSYPYEERENKVVRIPFRNIDEIGPAGSINSSVEEMARYIQFHIDQGKVGEEQLLSKANSREMQRPQMVAGGDPPHKELGYSSYGLGLSVTAYRGRKLVQHGGGIDGFISAMAWLPNDKIGVMVLSNFSGNNPVPTLVTRNLFDRLLGLDQVDWVGRTLEQQKKQEKAQQESEKKKLAERKEGTKLSHALADYAGSYEHPAYGRIQINAGGTGLQYQYLGISGNLNHYHYDIFEVEKVPGNPLAETKVTFLYDKKGDIDRVTVPLEPSVEDIVFSRVDEESMKQRK